MVDKMGDVAIVTSIHSERAVAIIVVKVEEICAALSVIHFPSPLSFFVGDHLKSRKIHNANAKIKKKNYHNLPSYACHNQLHKLCE
jgi:hypothetical protein